MNQSWWYDFRYWLSDHKKIAWSAVVAILLLAAIPLSVYLVQQQQQLDTEASWSGFFEGVHLCALSGTKPTCPFTTDLSTETYQVESTVLVSGNIYRNSGDEQLNEDVGLFLDGEEIFRSEDRAGMPENHTEPFGPLEFTIQPGEHTFSARHLDSSNNPSSAGSVGIDIAISVVDYTAMCREIKIYDLEGNQLSVDEVYIDQQVQLAVLGDVTEPQGLTKARFSFDGGSSWQETNQKNSQGEYYLNWTVPDETEIDLQAQVYNPNLGWR